MNGLAGDALRLALLALVRGRVSAITFGAVFTVLIQSSSATALTIIGFVSAGLVSFSQHIGALVGPRCKAATFGRKFDEKRRSADEAQRV